MKIKSSPSLKLVIALLPILLFALACSRLSGLKTNYFEGDNAAKMVAKVKSEVGKPFKVVEAVVQPDEMRIQILPDGDSRNVDEYKSRAGFVTGPNPVKLSFTDPSSAAIPLEEINFDVVSRIADEAVKRVAIEGGKVTRMTVGRGFTIQGTSVGNLGNPQWRIEIEGTRETASATANLKGEIVGLDLSRTSRARDYSVLSAEELKKAQAALKSVVGDGRGVESVIIRHNSVEISSVATDGSNDLLTFTYGIDGVKKGLTSRKAISSRVQENFAIDDIDFSVTLDYISKARERLGLPNAKISAVSFSRSVRTVINLADKSNQIYVSLQDGRTEGGVTFDLTDGSEISANLNGRSLDRR